MFCFQKQLSEAKENFAAEESAHKATKMQLQNVEHQVQHLKDEVR